MKNSIKRCLILVVVIMAMVVTTLVVCAAGTPYCNDCKNGTTITGNTIYPTCETGGYVELLCSDCKRVIGRTNEIGPDNHSYSDSYEIPENANYYEKVEICGKCKNVRHPEPNAKYYKVTFYNSFSSNIKADGSKYYVADCPYVDLIDAENPDAYRTKVLKTDYYVKEGEKAICNDYGVREADKTFNTYSLAGWVEESKIADSNAPDFGIIDTRVASKRAYNDDNEYELVNKDHYETIFGNGDDKERIFMSKNGFEVPLEGDVKADYNVYAVYDASNKNHTVEFTNADNKVVYTVKNIMHGGSVEYDFDAKGTPIKTANHRVYYEFDNKWIYTDKNNFSYDIDLEHIYANIRISPSFTMHSKTYNFKYYDVNGNVYRDEKGKEITELVAIAGPEVGDYAPKKGRAIDVKDYYDESYMYIYTGLWRLRNNKSVIIDINNVDLPTNILSYQDESTGYITLEPAHIGEKRVYSMSIEIAYPYENNNYPEDVTVQITNAENYTRKIELTSKDVINRDAVDSGREAPKYKFVVQGLNYSKTYKVTATSRTYQAVNDRILFHTGTTAETYYFYPVIMELEHLKQKDCNCLCHSIIKPIWVAALNLLNTLFGVEYVCCDDMFANIGDRLNYGK